MMPTNIEIIGTERIKTSLRSKGHKILERNEQLELGDEIVFVTIEMLVPLRKFFISYMQISKDNVGLPSYMVGGLIVRPNPAKINLYI